MEEKKNATEEPFDPTAFAQLLFGPRGRQTGAIFLAFGMEGGSRLPRPRWHESKR